MHSRPVLVQLRHDVQVCCRDSASLCMAGIASSMRTLLAGPASASSSASPFLGQTLQVCLLALVACSGSTRLCTASAASSLWPASAKCCACSGAVPSLPICKAHARHCAHQLPVSRHRSLQTPQRPECAQDCVGALYPLLQAAHMAVRDTGTTTNVGGSDLPEAVAAAGQALLALLQARPASPPRQLWPAVAKIPLARPAGSICAPTGPA